MNPTHASLRSLSLLLLLGLLACGGGGEEEAASAVPPPIPAGGDCVPEPTSPFEVNVRNAPYNAKGDGSTNDTTAIQAAVDDAKGTGGTVIVPSGTYLVNPVASSGAGLRLGSDMTLLLQPGAVLQAMSTSTSNHVVLLVSGCEGVHIVGGTLIGNRNNNTITDNREGGDGIRIVKSTDVIVEGVTARDFWEDGFYVGEGSRNVALCAVLADNNRRHGMGITDVDGLLLKDSTFRNSTGFMEGEDLVCGTGIDLEPNEGGTVNNVLITGCTFTGNTAEGIAVCVPLTLSNGRITQVVIDGNTASGNGFGKLTGSCGIGISNTSGHTVRHNTVRDNLGDGIYLTSGANNNTVTGNTVSGTDPAEEPGDAGHGIMLYRSSGNNVSGNTVTGCAGCGIRNASGTNTIGANTLSGNGQGVCNQ